MGVRLTSGAAAAVLRDRVDRATGIAVSLDEVWSRLEVDQLADELGTADGDAGRALALTHAISRAVSTDWRPDPAVARVVEQLRSTGGDLDAANLDIGALSSRQFRRRFSAAMGYGPAFYGRIARLARFVDLLDQHQGRTLAELAAQAGFFDQAHLARDVRQLLGTTPSRLRPAT